MNRCPPRYRKGFTLVEIMVVVAIIALLAAIATPGFLRARKRSQATVILDDLRLLSDAQEVFFMADPENAPTIGWPGLQPYIKKGTRLYNSFEGSGDSAGVRDLFGHFYESWGEEVGQPQVGISAETYNALSDVAPREFWEPFISSDVGN